MSRNRLIVRMEFSDERRTATVEIDTARGCAVCTDGTLYPADLSFLMDVYEKMRAKPMSDRFHPWPLADLDKPSPPV